MAENPLMYPPPDGQKGGWSAVSIPSEWLQVPFQGPATLPNTLHSYGEQKTEYSPCHCRAMQRPVLCCCPYQTRENDVHRPPPIQQVQMRHPCPRDTYATHRGTSIALTSLSCACLQPEI